MAELQRRESDLERVQFQLESQRESRKTLVNERETLEERRKNLEDDAVNVEVDAIESDIQRLRERKQTLSTELNQLQNVIRFNKEMLDGTSEDIASALRDDPSADENVTDQLVETNDSIVCWTCGTSVEQDSIEETLERLQGLRKKKHDARSDIESRIDNLKKHRDDAQSKRHEHDRVESELADIRTEIDERDVKIEELEAKYKQITEEIAALEDEVEDLEQQNRSEVLEVHREVNQLEVELEQLKDNRERVADNIGEIESQLEHIDNLEAKREAIQSKLANLRTRIEQTEEEAVKEFNDHMDTVLDILDYTNLDRIWVERTESEIQEGRQKITKSEFDLHVIRSPDEGVTYEDDFTHLSESEREVTGFVFALAGYLVHEVYEEVPFMLLDSLEAIDSDRIAKLVEYFNEYADYLVVALLTEDAAALDDSYQRVQEI